MNFVRLFGLILIFLGYSITGFSQSYFRLIDKVSGEFLNSYGSEIIQDGYLNFAQLNHEKGKEVLKYIRWSDDPIEFSNHEFFLSVNRFEYLPVWIPIDLAQKDTLDVFLDPDQNYVSSKTELHHNICGEPIYRKYYPKPLRSWSDLPLEVEMSVKEKLLKSIGSDLFNKLYISSIYEYEGTKMNEAEGRLLYPDGEKGYRICLSFSDIDAGVAQYSSDFFVNKNGQISKMPAFPNWNQGALFGQIKKELMPFEKIEEIVEKDGSVNLEVSNSTFEFYQRANTFSWVFKEITGKSEEGFQMSKSTYFDAVSGKLLAVLYDESLVIEEFY